jgi:hypothetical protein
MDPALLLDTLSPDDMEMWQCGYNFFNEENVNSSFKESVKEENMEAEYCLSSICPNDLLNNLDDQNYLFTNINYGQNNTFNQPIISNNNSNNNDFVNNITDKYDSYSSSSSYSSPSSSFSQNLEDNHQQFNMVPCSLNNGQSNSSGALNLPIIEQHEFKVEESSRSSITDQQFFQLDSTAISSSSASQSPSPSTSPFSSIKEFNIFKHQSGNYQARDSNQASDLVLIANTNNNKNKNKATLKSNKRNSSGLLQTKSSKSKQTIKKLTALSEKSNNENTNNDTIVISNSNNAKQLKKTTLLPPSPPSSFGSESDSDNSTSSESQKLNMSHTKICNNKQSANNINYISKTNKLNSSLRSNAFKHQIRHQPYALKSTIIHSSNNKLNKTFSPVLESERITVSSSNQSSTKEERDNSCEDDDCWPFLCSLSVSI